MENLKNFKPKGKKISREEKLELISQGVSYCAKCKSIKVISEFGKCVSNRYGITPSCSLCEKNRASKARANNPEPSRIASLKHRQKHRDYYLAQKKEWDKNNRGHINKYKRDKYNTDPIYKMQVQCRLMVRRMFKSIKKDKMLTTSLVLGYTAKDLKEHIEKQFTEGMNWNNHGEWHVDHMIPLSEAKNLRDGIFLSQLENLQPLWAEDNLEKHNKF